MKYISNLDLCKNELQNVRVQNLATHPANPVAGQIYYSTTDGTIYMYDGQEWKDLSKSGEVYSAGNGITISSGTISNAYGYQDKTLRLYNYTVNRATTNTLEELESALESIVLSMMSGIRLTTTLLTISDPNGNDGTFEPYIGTYLLSSCVNITSSSGTVILSMIGGVASDVYVSKSEGDASFTSLEVMNDRPRITASTSYNSSTGEYTINQVSVVNFDEFSNTLKVLDTNTDYQTPYTPLYQGSPATKGYVDSSVSSSVSKDSVGTPGGVASLDDTGKVPSSQLPSYVDDVVEGYYYDGGFYSDEAHTNLITPETGKIYVDITTNKAYRWGGSVYVEISQSTIHKFVGTFTLDSNTTSTTTITHNLSSEDVVVSVWSLTTKEMVIMNVEVLNANAIKIGYVNAPSGQYKVVIVA